MALAYTISNVTSIGKYRMVTGTFTSASGDTTFTLAPATHGLNNIIDFDVSIKGGAVDAQTPKTTNSSGTITAIWDDTQGLSGTFTLIGN